MSPFKVAHCHWGKGVVFPRPYELDPVFQVSFVGTDEENLCYLLLFINLSCSFRMCVGAVANSLGIPLFIMYGCIVKNTYGTACLVWSSICGV